MNSHQGLFITLVFGCAIWAVAASPAPDPLQKDCWVGDLRIGSTILSLRLEDMNGSPILKAITEDARPFPAKVLARTDDQVTLDLIADGRTIRVVLDRGVHLSGVAECAGVRGTAQFVRVLPTAPPLTWTGVYSGGSSVVLCHPLSELGPGLFLTNVATGEIGALHPRLSDTAVMASSVGSPVLPERAAVRFIGGGATEVPHCVEIRQPDGEPARYDRQPLLTHEVWFTSGSVRLSGTVTRPPSPRPRPGIVLIHGSGPLDREALALWTGFFNARGLGVLSYDKRGTGESGGDWRVATFEDLARDAEAAVAGLRAEPGIDSRRVGIFGISQGGWIAPQVAAAVPDLAFIILHAGGIVSPGEQGLKSLAAELQAHGLTDVEVAEAVALQRLDDDVTRGKRPWSDYKVAYETALGSHAEWLVSPLNPEGSWFRSFYRGIIDFNARPYWAKVRCPVLAVFGDRDLIVASGPNAALLREAMPEGVRLRIENLPDANHLCFQAETGVRSEYLSRGRFAAGYFPLLTRWIAEVLGQ